MLSKIASLFYSDETKMHVSFGLLQGPHKKKKTENVNSTTKLVRFVNLYSVEKIKNIYFLW